MSIFFASIFPTQDLAEQGQQIIETYAERDELKLVSSVVIAKNADGSADKYRGKNPGALGATMSALVGGTIGLIGGPAVVLLGALAGGLSGGWFDILRAEDREEFMNRIAHELGNADAALLGEVINPGEDIRKLIEADLAAVGGKLVN